MDDPEGTDPILARWFDRATRRTWTMLTDRTSRRRFVRRLGGLMVGAGAWTLLPVSRAFGADDADGAELVPASDDAATANLRESVATNWYCVRRTGTARRRGWTTDRDPVQIATNVDAGRGDVVEVCVAGTAREVPRGHRFASVFYNRVRGVVGIELEYRGERARYAPTQMISDNLSFERVRDRFLEQHGASESDFANAGHLWVFPARQYLVGAGDDSPVELVRGSTSVALDPPAGEDRPAVLADGIGAWMLANLSAEGGLPYKYWPSRGDESPADNAIRRFLATIALARLGEARGSFAIRSAARRNLRYNLGRYFRPLDDGRGVIVEQTGAKLGATALAALAILEVSAPAGFSTELDMLAKGVDSLFDAKDGFRTFFFPAERDGQNWNFYSGEALLFWAEALRRRAPCAPPLDRCVKAFEACRDRHRRRRNPAFVPWHTQACTSLYALTRQRPFAEWVFEMNDWLLPMQQWEGLAEDLRGRFYDPKRPEFGPPHASSTGVYCEGLADAAALARAVGDSARAASYERAVERGMRSLRQLQFRDERDAFYVSRRQRVMGALRTEVYDNAIRVDSAGHALAAAIKVSHPIRI